MQAAFFSCGCPRLSTTLIKKMRKLREDGRRTEQPALLPLEACDPKPDSAPLHSKLQDDVVDRSAANKRNREQMTCGGPGDELEPTTEEDTDSAVSSAPSSLSPQPCSPLNDDCGPLRCVLASRASITLRDTPPPTSLSPQPSEGYTTPPLDMWTDDGHTDGGHYNTDDDGRTESELTMAKRQVRELERALLMTRAAKSGRHVMALSERIRQLEDRESELLREVGDLREQNELLEFRVLELAECPDKSAIIGEQWLEKQDACTGTGDEHLVNQLNEDAVRQRLLEMSRNTGDTEDKRCLLQVLMLLYGLEELSRRHTDGLAMDTNAEQMEQVQLPSLLVTGGARGPVRERQPDRLVAKVPPFTGRSAESDDDRSTPVRAQEPAVPVLSTRGTQTEKSTSTSRSDKEEEEEEEDDEDAKALNLTAEVRKLDKLRETIEVVGNRNGRLVVSGGSCSEQKHAHQLEFYRDRVDVLERKVHVYESSGETQVRQLAERLNREVRLQAQVKQLTAAVQKLQTDNSRLEEERCELEEAENDTRLRCQRLETEVVQLERSRMSSKRRAREARNQATYWESMVAKYEERIYELEELECDLRHRLEVVKDTSPVVLLFNMWQKMQRHPEFDVAGEALDRLKRGEPRGRSATRSKSRSPQRRGCACSSANDKIKTLQEERDRLASQKRTMELKVRELETQMPGGRHTKEAAPRNGSLMSIDSGDMELMKMLQDLKERERDMKKRIEELEHRESAYMETLQQADDIWADMEAKYKQRIEQAEHSESNMRDRLRRLEKREAALDVGELEESERALSKRAERLERENKRLGAENKRLERELKEARDDSVRHADNVASRLGADLDRERRRGLQLEGRLGEAGASLRDAGKAHQAEVDVLKERLSRTTNELVHLEVTNGELREEVDTLEAKIAEMERTMTVRVATDEQMIRGLSQELNERDRELAEMQKRERESAAAAGERLGAALQSVKQCDVCSEAASPDLVETVEGVRTMCELVSCPTTRPPDDAQVSEGGDGLECTSATCPEKLKQGAPATVVSVYKTTSKTAASVLSQKYSEVVSPAGVVSSAAYSEQYAAVLTQKTSTIVSQTPSAVVSQIPSAAVSHAPSAAVSHAPSVAVSHAPSAAVSQAPSAAASHAPSAAVSQKPSMIPVVQVSLQRASSVLSSTLSAVKSIIKPVSAQPSTALLTVPSAGGVLPIKSIIKPVSAAPSAALLSVSAAASIPPKKSSVGKSVSFHAASDSTKVISEQSMQSGAPSSAVLSRIPSAVKSGTGAESVVASVSKQTIAKTVSAVVSKTSTTGAEKSITVLAGVKSGMISSESFVASRHLLDAPSQPSVKTPASAKSVASPHASEVEPLAAVAPAAVTSVPDVAGDEDAVQIEDMAQMSLSAASITAASRLTMAKSQGSKVSAMPTRSTQSTRITVDLPDNLLIRHESRFGVSPSGVSARTGLIASQLSPSHATSSMMRQMQSVADDESGVSNITAASSRQIASPFGSEMTRTSSYGDVGGLMTEMDVLGTPPYEELIAVIDMQTGPTPEGFDVSATVTESGNLELETQGPPGIVDHTMVFTDSGNLGIVTEFTPLPEAAAAAGAIQEPVPSYFYEGKEPTGPDIKEVSQPPSAVTVPVSGVSSAQMPGSASSAGIRSQPGSAGPNIGTLMSAIKTLSTTPSPYDMSSKSAAPSAVASKEATIAQIISQLTAAESKQTLRTSDGTPVSKQASIAQRISQLQQAAGSTQIITHPPSTPALISAVPSASLASRQASVAQMKQMASLQVPGAVSRVPSAVKTGKEPSVHDVGKHVEGQESHVSMSKHVSFFASQPHLQVSSEKIISAVRDTRSERELISITLTPAQSQEQAAQRLLGDVSQKSSGIVMGEGEREGKSQEKANVGVQCTCPVMRADKDEPQPFNYNDIMQLVPRMPLANMEQVLCVCPVFQQQTSPPIRQCAPPLPQMYGGPGYFYGPALYPPPPPPPMFGAGYLPCPAFLPPPPPAAYPPMGGQFPSPGFPAMNMQFPCPSYPPMNQAQTPYNLPYQHPQQAMYPCPGMCGGSPGPRMPEPIPRPMRTAQNIQTAQHVNTADESNVCETYTCPLVLVQKQSIIKYAYADAEAAARQDKKAEEASKGPSTTRVESAKQSGSKLAVQELHPSGSFVDHSDVASRMSIAGESAAGSEPGSLLSVSLEFEFGAESDATLPASTNVSGSHVSVPVSSRVPSAQPSDTTQPSSRSTLRKSRSKAPTPTSEKSKHILSVTSVQAKSSKVTVSATPSLTNAKKSAVSFKSATSTISTAIEESPKPSAFTLRPGSRSPSSKSVASSKSIMPIIKTTRVSSMSLKDRPSIATPSQALSKIPVRQSSSVSSPRSSLSRSPAIASKVPSKQTSRAITPRESSTGRLAIGSKAPSRQPSRALASPAPSKRSSVSVTPGVPAIVIQAPSKQSLRASASTAGSPAVASQASSKHPSRMWTPKPSTAVPSKIGIASAPKPGAAASGEFVKSGPKELAPSHGKNCSCDTCKCRPCKDPKAICVPREPKADTDQKGRKSCPVCQCEVCRCPDCIDPSKTKTKGPDAVLSSTVREDTLREYGPGDRGEVDQPPPDARPAPQPGTSSRASGIPALPSALEGGPVNACDCEACECEACPDRKKSHHTETFVVSASKFTPVADSTYTKGFVPILASTQATRPDMTVPPATVTGHSADFFPTNASVRGQTYSIPESSYTRGEFVPILASTQATLPDMTEPPDSATYDTADFFPTSSSVQEPSNSILGVPADTTVQSIPSHEDTHDFVPILDSTQQPMLAHMRSADFVPIVASTQLPLPNLTETIDRSVPDSTYTREVAPILASTQATRPYMTVPLDTVTGDSADFFPTSSSVQEPSSSILGVPADTTVHTIPSYEETEDFVPILDSTQQPMLDPMLTADFIPIVASTQLPPPNLTETIESSAISYTFNAPSQYGSSEPSSVPQHSGDVGLFGMMMGLGRAQPQGEADKTQVKEKEPAKDGSSAVQATPLHRPDRLGHPPDCKCVLCQCDPCENTRPPQNALMIPLPAHADSTLDIADKEKRRLPPSLIGPDFIKPCIRDIPSRAPLAIALGEKEALRPVAVKDAAEWRSLDTETLKQRFLEMEKEAKQRANEIDQIRKFMDGLNCACHQQLQKVQHEHPLVAPEPSRSFAATISGLQCALAFLQDKCEKKDRLIAAVTAELRLRAESGVFERVLQNVAAKTDDAPVLSFDRLAVSNALPKPDTVQRQVMRMPAEKPCATAGTARKKAASPPTIGGDVCCCDPTPGNVDPTPLAIAELRRIAPDSILVKWERPASKHVKGYEVEVNGVTKSRVYSAGRTVAVLNGLQLDKPVQVCVYAVSVTGLRCQPPATAMYQGATTRPGTRAR